MTAQLSLVVYLWSDYCQEKDFTNLLS